MLDRFSENAVNISLFSKKIERCLRVNHSRNLPTFQPFRTVQPFKPFQSSQTLQPFRTLQNLPNPSKHSTLQSFQPLKPFQTFKHLQTFQPFRTVQPFKPFQSSQTLQTFHAIFPNLLTIPFHLNRIETGRFRRLFEHSPECFGIQFGYNQKNEINVYSLIIK